MQIPTEQLPTFGRHKKIYTFHNIQKDLYRVKILKIQQNGYIQYRKEMEKIKITSFFL